MRALLIVPLLVAALLIALACGGDDQQQQAAPPAVAQAESVQQEPQRQQTPPAQQAAQTQSADTQQAAQTIATQAKTQDEAQAKTQGEAQDEQKPAADIQKLTIGGERPAALLLPANYDDSEPLPLVLMLHGYGSSAAVNDAWMGASQLVAEGGFGLILPDGTLDPDGNRFWNATEACCNFYRSDVNDAAYLAALVAEAQTYGGAGPVAAVGVSNGGFMAYRLACEGLPGLIAVVSVMGSSFNDPTDCAAPAPVSVLQIHGDADAIVRYDGGLADGDGVLVADTPGATEVVWRWAQRAGCNADAREDLDSIELDHSSAGAETTVQRIRQSCADGVTVELWTMQGIGHFPAFQPYTIGAVILGWLAGVAGGGEGEPPAAAESNGLQRLTLGGERPAAFLLPETRLLGPLPLVVLLHGFGMNAELIDRYFGLSQMAEDGLIALITPDGTENPDGDRFWNATPECCKFEGQDVDDVGYINGLVAEAREYAAFDRLYLVGYSNGGFMSYRMACENMPGLTALVSVAGSSYIDPAECPNPTPVSVLQIHGTADALVPYNDDPRGVPGAETLVRLWAERAGCDFNAAQELEPIELDFSRSDPETTVRRIREGCTDGVTIELWTMLNIGHGPDFSRSVIAGRIIGWLLIESRAETRS